MKTPGLLRLEKKKGAVLPLLPAQGEKSSTWGEKRQSVVIGRDEGGRKNRDRRPRD